jgi:pyruvate dehydrogenase E2 component (dihydrolipoamide acetyltransferase)
MPQVGHNIPSARIVEWLKKENEPVNKGEIILVVESEKAAFEVEAEDSGVLLEILHAEGEEVAVFKPLAYIGMPGETFKDEGGFPPDETTVTHPGVLEPINDQPRGDSGMDREPAPLLASPSARRLARKLAVDLTRVKGSGPHSRIIERDVRAAASTAQAEAAVSPGALDILPEDIVMPLGTMRKQIADRMTLSNETIPHFYLFLDVDMSEALNWRAKVNHDHATHISVTDMIIKACALALTKFPRMNTYVESDRIILKKRVHIGVATSVDDGILLPVTDNADSRSLTEISEISKKNTAAARRGFILAKNLGTFTISTLGMYGIDQFLPIINPPECAILGVGAIRQRVVPATAAFRIRQRMTLTLGCDHRAVDGVYAARFLNQIKHHLESVFSDVGESVL